MFVEIVDNTPVGIGKITQVGNTLREIGSVHVILPCLPTVESLITKPKLEKTGIKNSLVRSVCHLSFPPDRRRYLVLGMLLEALGGANQAPHPVR
jgi:hypothetical protein